MENTRINNLYQSMLNNPDFVKFVEKNKHKSIAEIAMEYDLKIDFIKENDVYKS